MIYYWPGVSTSLALAQPPAASASPSHDNVGIELFFVFIPYFTLYKHCGIWDEQDNFQLMQEKFTIAIALSIHTQSPSGFSCRLNTGPMLATIGLALSRHGMAGASASWSNIHYDGRNLGLSWNITFTVMEAGFELPVFAPSFNQCNYCEFWHEDGTFHPQWEAGFELLCLLQISTYISIVKSGRRMELSNL